MIIVHAECPIASEQRAEVETRGAEFAAKNRSEEGCIAYQLSWKFGEPAILCLVENWESMAAYKAHVAQEHVAEWAAWIPGKSLGSLQSKRYNVEPVDPPGF